MAISEAPSDFHVVAEKNGKVLLQHEEHYAIARKPSKEDQFRPTTTLSLESYCPVAPSGVTRARALIAPIYHIKRPRLEQETWGEEWGLEELKARTAREVRICETLLKPKSHPNLATYHGCAIKYGLITGICYSLYDETLQERLNPSRRSKLDFQYRDAERPLASRKDVIEGVGRGLRFLHAQRLVHNDIKPDNIMLGLDEMPVIIDFDACVPYGGSLAGMGRAVGWHDPRNGYSLYSNDWDALAEVEMWMGDGMVKGYRFGDD